MRTSHRILREAQRAMDEATSWSSWSDAASAHDQLTGMDAWRADDACEAYDATLLRDDLNRLRALREAGDLLGLGDHMHDSLTRHHADLADPALFHAAWGGTKRLVEDYLDEVVRDLTFLADHPVPEPLATDRVRRFSLAARNYGRSCLMLSGGGTLGWIHLGVTKALFENGLLPGVITGASMGAMIAAGICARTDAELVDLFANPGQIRTYGLKPVGIGATARSGALLDPAVLLDTIRHNCGSYTFEESFARTGRALSISVSPTRRGQRPRLLNHLTAPHVMIPESALASSAIPGAFPPSALVAKGADGVQRSYLGTERWIDGSIHEDLPKWRVGRLFNVNHFIVSQTNPHVVPFLSDPRRGGPWRTVAGLTGSAALQQGRIALSAIANLTADTPLRPWTSLAHGLVSQEYRGDIDIHPSFHPRLLRKAFTNADEAELRAYILLGERATWPHLARIRLETAVSRAFDQCLRRMGVAVEIGG